MQYIIWGWAAVFDPDGVEVTDLVILAALADFVDEEDLYQTDYIGGSPDEDELATALERSGQMRFSLYSDECALRVRSTFLARRALTVTELELLKQLTLGQWTDGMGECLYVPNGIYAAYKLQPLDADEAGITNYPFVEIIASNLR